MVNEDRIKEIALKKAIVSAADIAEAERSAKESSVPLSQQLVSMGLVTSDTLGEILAEAFGVTYADLNSKPPHREQVLKIDKATALRYRAILFSEDDSSVVVTTDDPDQKGLAAALGAIFSSKKIVLAYSLPRDIDVILMNYRTALKTRFAEIIKRATHVAPQLLEAVFSDALEFRASDIHFEPKKDEVLIRFRIDGVLNEAGRIPREHYDNMLNRVKVQAHLRIDEHFSAQDGAIRYEDKGTVVDMRLSIVPTISGEKMVVRLLAQYVKSLTLGDLGISSRHQKIITDAAHKPFGMLLVVGPTGSGKTTTLYALLNLVSKPDVNVITIEDPVEYRLESINQIQVNLQTNLTFSKGLRSIVRQDPDIILVGEVRDNETAEISVNAALTGHLLLSTFHSNDAVTAIPRLLDMGVEPFLLSSTLELVIAQRLVRKLCENCRHTFRPTPEYIEKLPILVQPYFSDADMTLYKAEGCSLCNNTGFNGRTAIFEFIPMTPQMQDLLLQSPSSQQIWDLAKKQGVQPLFADGVEKVKQGVTTVEELMRVAAPPGR